MSKTTAVLNTRQTIVFHFVLGYKLGHSCTYRQIALNYRVYSIKATNLKLAPTSNKRPWKENSRSAHPHPQPSPPPRPIQLQQNQQKLQWTRRVGCLCPICTLPIRCSCVPTDPLFLLILLTLCSYSVPSFYFPMTSVRSSYTSHKPLGWLICRCYAVRHVRGNTREFA